MFPLEQPLTNSFITNTDMLEECEFVQQKLKTFLSRLLIVNQSVFHEITVDAFD